MKLSGLTKPSFGKPCSDNCLFCSFCVLCSLTITAPLCLQMKSGVPIVDLPFYAWSNGNLSPKVTFSGISMAQILSGVPPLPEGNANVSVSTSKSSSPESAVEKPAVEVARNQDYPSPEPIPEGEAGRHLQCVIKRFFLLYFFICVWFTFLINWKFLWLNRYKVLI